MSKSNLFVSPSLGQPAFPARLSKGWRDGSFGRFERQRRSGRFAIPCPGLYGRRFSGTVGIENQCRQRRIKNWKRFKTAIDLRTYAAIPGYELDRRESWRGSSRSEGRGSAGQRSSSRYGRYGQNARYSGVYGDRGRDVYIQRNPSYGWERQQQRARQEWRRRQRRQERIEQWRDREWRNERRRY